MSPRAVGRHATRAGGLEADPATVPLLPLKPGEWTVLGLLGGGTMYGFGLLKATAPDGELGRVWSVPMPVVYRSTSSLRASGLIEPVGEERSDAGPPRTLLGITPAGRQQLLLRPSTPGAHIAPGARARTAACEPRSPRAARGTGDPVHATGCWTGAACSSPWRRVRANAGMPAVRVSAGRHAVLARAQDVAAR